MFGSKTRRLGQQARRIDQLQSTLADTRHDLGTAVFVKDRAIASTAEALGRITELESQLQAARNLNARLNARLTSSPQTVTAGGTR